VQGVSMRDVGGVGEPCALRDPLGGENQPGNLLPE